MSKTLKSSEEREQGSRGAGEKGNPPSPFRPFVLSLFHELLSVAIVAAAAFWLYRRALGFAYFNDDPTGHFAWMEGQSLWQFFTGSTDYGYYRPVVFAVLRLSEILFGNEVFPHNSIADHALLLLLHAANAAMVWLLARRLSGRESYAWAAALVFAFVPFSYEAVAYVASLTHPLVVFWTLLALLLYDWRAVAPLENGGMGEGGKGSRGERETGNWSLVTGHWPLIAALLTMCLGLLTHENGLFIFPALVGLDWVRRPHSPLRGRARRLWLFAVPPILFAILWLLIPKNSEQGLNSLADVGRNLLPFLQTLVYPLLPLFHLDASDTVLLVVLAVAVVAIAGLLAWRAGAWRLWAYALGWFALASLPALLFLSPTYVYGSPRLSYLPSIGVAMLWAIPALAMSGVKWQVAGSRRQVAGIVLAVAYAVALTLPGVPFIHCQLDFYDETSRFARAMAAAGAAAPAGQEVIFVNAPFFFSSTAARPEGCPSPYSWTPVGGVLVPPYAQARDFVRFNGGPDRSVTGVAYAGYNPGWRTFGAEIDGPALREHAAADATYVFDLLGGSFADLSAAWQPDAGATGEPLATFGGALALVGAEPRRESDWLDVTLDWRVIAETAEPLAAFVHVYDAAGALAAQSDGPPGAGLAPQPLWAAGDGLIDERAIDISALPSGVYRVAVGVYNAADGTRLAVEANGVSSADSLVTIGTLER